MIKIILHGNFRLFGLTKIECKTIDNQGVKRDLI